MVELAHKVGALVLIDGAQAVPHVPVDVQELGADFYVFSGHKMLGPMGSGALWARRELLEAMPPFLSGGEMIREVHLRRSDFNDIPWKFEAGTPAVGDAIGLGAAVGLPVGDRDGRCSRTRDLSRRVRPRHAGLKRSPISRSTVRWTRRCGAGSCRSTCRASTRMTWPRVGPLWDRGPCRPPLHDAAARTVGPVRLLHAPRFNVYSTREDVDALAAGLKEVQRVFNG